MKKLIYGLSAIALAIGGVIATHATKPLVNQYYFDYTSGGTLSTAQPALVSYGCTGSDTKCEIFATSFTVSGNVYSPLGTQVLHKKAL